MALVFISDGRSAEAAALATHLAQNGYCVALNGADAPGCERVDLDLTDLKGLEDYFAGCGALAGAVHFAPPPRPVPIEDADDRAIAGALRAGALSSLLLARAAGDAMAAQGRGALIFVGDLHAEKPTGCAPLHAMNVAAMQMLSREAALDYGRRGLSSFFVMRGPAEGDAPMESGVSNLREGAAIRHPDGALPPAGHLGGLIAFLLTDGARPLNGADLRADSGYAMYYGLQRREVAP
ncbi:MAG: SDR family oxidoreductase [Clostridiales bacterium]|nr:SDR family oxidoreductase [Clostridiales bacterium]